MRRYSAILVLLLFHYASSVQCFPEADYEDGVPDLGDDEFSSPYDESDSDTDIQPLLDPPPDLISAGAGAGDDCSTFDMTPNGKIRARGAVCSSDQAPPPSTPLDIPTLDIFHDTNYLCPFDMNFGYRILVCGKPLSIYGLAPEIVTTVKEARLYARLPSVKCEFPNYVFCCDDINELVMLAWGCLLIYDKNLDQMIYW